MKKFNLFMTVGITSFALVKTYEFVQVLKAEAKYQKENQENEYKREYIKIPIPLKKYWFFY